MGHREGSAPHEFAGREEIFVRDLVCPGSMGILQPLITTHRRSLCGHEVFLLTTPAVLLLCCARVYSKKNPAHERLVALDLARRRNSQCSPHEQYSPSMVHRDSTSAMQLSTESDALSP